jgi:signal transduction histidine kinase
MFYIEQRLITKDGNPKWILTRGKVTETTQEGKPKRMTGTHTDISQQKAQEFQLLETQFQLKQQNKEYLSLNEELHKINEQLIVARHHAEESDRLKSVFLQNMSHEIRTPLNGILGFTDLLTTNNDLSPTKRSTYAAIITRSADSLMQIINDILDLSRLETDQFSLNKKRFLLNDTLKDLHTLYRKKMDDKGKQHIKLVVNIPPVHIVLHNDEQRLTQILINLLDNAIKFTHQGQIQFGIKQILPNRITLTVSDTGIGIAKEKHAVIFERFTQADTTTSVNYGGTGLGLSIVKKLVNIMEGTIAIESEPGSGTSFTLNLPYESNSFDDVEKNESKEDASEIKYMEVLLVEDDESSIVYYKEILDQEKIKLHIAQNGADALFMYKELRPHAILMDIRLPDMSGLDVVKEIRKSNRKIKIIAQSAFAMATDEVNALEAGCNIYLSKPVSAAVLLKSLQLKT